MIGSCRFSSPLGCPGDWMLGSSALPHEMGINSRFLRLFHNFCPELCKLIYSSTQEARNFLGSIQHTLSWTHCTNMKPALPQICSRCQYTAHALLQSFLILPPQDHHQSCPPKSVLFPPPSWRAISQAKYNREHFYMPCNLFFLNLLAISHSSHHCPFICSPNKHVWHAGNVQGTAEEWGGVAHTGSVLKRGVCRVACKFSMAHSF